TRLARAAARTRLTADDVLVAALRGPVVLWFAMLGLYLATEVAELPGPVAQIIQRLLVLMIMVCVTWALARAAGNAVAARARAESAALPSVNLVTNLAKAVVIGLGALVILQKFGISITPLLTALDVGVSYDSDLRKVEVVTVEVGQEVMQQVEGGVRDFTPSIRYHTFGDSAIQFTVTLRGQEYVSQYLIKHEFIKRLHRRYREEG